MRAERDTGWMNCHSGRVKWPAERAWSVTVGLEDIRKVTNSMEKEREKKERGFGDCEVKCTTGHKFLVWRCAARKLRGVNMWSSTF